MATTITEKFYVKQNGKYDKETIIIEEDYPLDEELADAQTNMVSHSERSIEWKNKKTALESKKAAATTRSIKP
jgi:TfoX/Sxy family transcriptional regulator of competence genes